MTTTNATSSSSTSRTTDSRPTPPAGTRWVLSAGGKDEQGRRFREYSAVYTDGWRSGLTAKDGAGEWVRCRELLPEVAPRPYVQFRNRSEAEGALEDMERRAKSADARGDAKSAGEYRAEAERIRSKVLPAFPEVEA